jgi:hypothetical protein
MHNTPERNSESTPLVRQNNIPPARPHGTTSGDWTENLVPFCPLLFLNVPLIVLSIILSQRDLQSGPYQRRKVPNSFVIAFVRSNMPSDALGNDFANNFN